jgi:aspartate/methionine/tyrosine aminotransferase
MTGLRLGYLAVADAALRDRLRKVLFLTTSNVSSVVQYGGIGGLESPLDPVGPFRDELEARRDLFYAGVESLGGLFTGKPPKGAFYAFLKFDPEWRTRARTAPAAGHDSPSWALTEHLISAGRIGCVPGADFGPGGEGYVRFCFARDRAELKGALESMRGLFS